MGDCQENFLQEPYSRGGRLWLPMVPAGTEARPTKNFKLLWGGPWPPLRVSPAHPVFKHR